jgi:type II restriction/modification system DNA methylase subunit YeeA
MINPSLSFGVGNFRSLPAVLLRKDLVSEIVDELISINKKDYDLYEISRNFEHHFLTEEVEGGKCALRQIYYQMRNCQRGWYNRAKELEERNNKIYADHLQIDDEINQEISPSQVTLHSNPFYRYEEKLGAEDGEKRLQSEETIGFLSYVIGCMVGRYSLDKPGLVLASQGETVRDYLAQIPEPSFSPDKNAIIPLTDQEWFPDDATNRFRDFVRTVWGEEHLQENLDFVAESLCLHAIKPKKGEAAMETIRRYLSTQFYKDHLRTYKKRPIYWLFSSGKQKAFECLVYLHRYNESTLAEMRTDYVIPLTTKLASYVEKLEQDKDASTSAAEAKSIEKELSKLYKQQAELNTFDEKLRHYADQRISLDLDDGVKVNYGKFGDLLAEVKQVVGK